MATYKPTEQMAAAARRGAAHAASSAALSPAHAGQHDPHATAAVQGSHGWQYSNAI